MTTKSTFTIADALRIADIFEADDVIAVPAMACRVLATYVRELEQQLAEKPRDALATPLSK